MARGEFSRIGNTRFPGPRDQFGPQNRPMSGDDWSWLFRSGNNEGPFVENQGMINLNNWQDFYNNRRKFTENPYGQVPGREGREPIDDLRRAGFRTDDPSGWGWLQKKFEGYRGPHNPQGTQSPWNMQKYYDHPYLGIMTPQVTATMTIPEKRAYAQKRFTYDTGLRGGLSDESTYERKRRLEKANPGKTVQVGIKQPGNYDKYGNEVKRWDEGL